MWWLIYSADEERHVVQLLSIGPRKDVYERFDYRPAQAEGMLRSSSVLMSVFRE